MRLNERELSYFAQKSTRVDKRGYLDKRGQFNRTFKKRWFSLRGNLLFYYRDEADERKTEKSACDGKREGAEGR